MKGLFLFLFSFLIGNLAICQTADKPFIDKTIPEIKYQMSHKYLYDLTYDTVTVDLGTYLKYDLIDLTKESIVQNRILFYIFYFTAEKCDGVKMGVFGEDAVVNFISKINETYKQVESNVWVNPQNQTAIRITKLPPVDGKDLDLFEIDLGILTVVK